MRFVLFYRSLVSDWNNDSAHFLRGIASELIALGHAVTLFEPAGSGSFNSLREQCGEGAIRAFHAAYPRLTSTRYDLRTLDLTEALADVDVVIVHEWNDAELIRAIGRHRKATSGYKLLFHDTRRRTPDERVRDVGPAHDLSSYDGVLAYSEGLRQMYEQRGWAQRACTWREAVDARLFRPADVPAVKSLDVLWIGDWAGDRASDLSEFLIEPVRALGLRGRVYGACYHEEVVRTLRRSGIEYAGWIADFRIPAALQSAHCMVHVPRRLDPNRPCGIPTIRALEALACRVPLLSTPFHGCEELLEPGRDFLLAQDGIQMQRHLEALRDDPQYLDAVAEQGYATVLTRHTCVHRVDELLTVCEQLGANDGVEAAQVVHSMQLTAPLSAPYEENVFF